MAEYNLVEGKQELDKAKITVVASRYNSFIVERLLKACLNTLKKSGLQNQDITVVHVPGAFEIPSTVQHVIKHTSCDAVITLGAVIRGETPHFDYICSECTRGLGVGDAGHGPPGWRERLARKWACLGPGVGISPLWRIALSPCRP